MIPKYLRAKQGKYLKNLRARGFRRRIRQLVRVYKKDYSLSPENELHLPIIKEIFDIWSWD
jgi:hypothetical protein